MNQSELLTLSKAAPEFDTYLKGTFSNTHRALPLQTLNANTQSETVTFKIVPLSAISKPTLNQFIFQTFKVKNFLLVLFPLFLIFVKNYADGTLVDPLSAVIATLGIFCAFMSLGLRNDYLDHVRGFDRVLKNRGSRAIQNGWVTAEQVKKYSLYFLILAILCAVPIVVSFPSVLAVLAVSAVTGVWAYQIGSELSQFLLLGPFLSVGYQLSMGMYFDLESLCLGLIWGWIVLYLNHLRNFLCIIESSQAKFKNTVNRIGFDNSRRMLAIWWVVFVLAYAGYHVFYGSMILGFYGTLLMALISIRYIAKLKKLATPAGSELLAVQKYAQHTLVIALLVWALENIWYLQIWKI